MEVSAILFITVFAIGATAMFVLIPVAIILNINRSFKYRREIAERFDKLRLRKMLAAVGIDLNEYLYREPAHRVHTHMTVCSGCTNTEVCDQHLASNETKVTDITFCSNQQSMSEYLDKKAA